MRERDSPLFRVNVKLLIQNTHTHTHTHAHAHTHRDTRGRPSLQVDHAGCMGPHIAQLGLCAVLSAVLSTVLSAVLRAIAMNRHLTNHGFDTATSAGEEMSAEKTVSVRRKQEEKKKKT